MRFHGSQSERSSENRDQFSDPPFLQECNEGKKNGKKNGIGERNPTTKNKKKRGGGGGSKLGLTPLQHKRQPACAGLVS